MIYKILIPIVFALAFAITSFYSHNKINKTYICDSVLDCNSNSYAYYKVKVYANGKRVYKPVLKKELMFNQTKIYFQK